MAKITYEYHSKGSPVVMLEKVDGFLVNEYTAYIDRGCNNWVLYPKRSVRVSATVRFQKKTVPVTRAIVLPPLTPVTVKPSYEDDKQTEPTTPPNQVTLL